jgi:hypothetical protein
MFNLLIFNFPFVVLAVFGPEGFRGHFQPFTDVLREIWPGVTRKMEIFLNRRKPRQRSIHPDRARRKTVFVFFVAFCQSRLAKSLRRTQKQIRPPIFRQRAETCLTFRVLV